MIPVDLAEKQAEAVVRNHLKRCKQNRKNAGSRRKEKLPTERTPRSIIPAMRKMIANPTISARIRVLLIYWLSVMENKPLPMPEEFWKSRDLAEQEKEVDFKIRDINETKS